jgi:hypothetical protein
LLTVAVTGVTLLAAACSRGQMPSSPAGSVSAVRQSPEALNSARAADLAYAACMRSQGVGNFPYPSAGGVAVIAPAAGIDPDSPAFRSAEGACRLAVPTAAVHLVQAGHLAPGKNAKLRWPAWRLRRHEVLMTVAAP